MRTEKHWEETKSSLSYEIARHAAFQLQEHVKALGYDPKGIKVLSKKQSRTSFETKADAILMWNEGPENWTSNVDLIARAGVCCAVKGNLIEYYDI